jgi:hypothetical protein
MDKPIPVKAYSKAQMALIYNLKSDTLRRWVNLVKHKIPDYDPHAKIFTPKQVAFLFDHWGLPDIDDNTRALLT